MAKQRLKRRAPSGTMLDLEWNGAAPGSGVSGVRFAGGSYGRGFQVHPRGAHDAAVRAFMSGAHTSRVVVGRREVKVSVAADRSSTTATLLSGHHELMTVFSGPAPSTSRILDLFGALDIDDAPEGMRVAPKRSTLLSVMNEHLLVVAEDFISLDTPGPAHSRRLVPGHRGARTESDNEVWRTPLPGRDKPQRRMVAKDYAYVVGGPKGVTEVVASDPAATSDRALLDVVDSVQVVWSAED